MDQPQQSMPSMAPKQPAIAPWLLIVFIIVLLAGGGYLGWYFYSKSKTTVPMIATQTNETANWKTYENKDYGFSIKYPSDYTILGLNGAQEIGDAFSYNIIFSSKDGQFTVNITEIGGSIVKPIGINSTTTSDITVAGQSGKKFDDLAYVVDGAKYRYAIMYTGDASVVPTQEQKNILKQMVSNFQFISTTSTADWKTYTNTDYGFSFKYPTGWENKISEGTIIFTKQPIIETELIESITVEKNTDNLSLEQVQAKFKSSGRNINSTTPVKIGGENATRIVTGEFATDAIIFVHQGYIFTIETQGNLFDTEVLSTFQFTK